MDEASDLFIVYNAGVKEQIAIEGYSYNYGARLAAGREADVFQKCSPLWRSRRRS